MERKIIKLVFITIFLYFNNIQMIAQSSSIISTDWINIISDTCIYDNNDHAAFTTMAEWKDSLFVAFREASSHVGPTDYGVIKVMVRDENNDFHIQHVFSIEREDLRDPCFAKLNNRFLLYSTFRYSELTDNGWTDLKLLDYNAPHPLYIWKIRPYKDQLFGIGHRWNNWPILMSTKDGANWCVVKEYQIGGNATEADLLFDKNMLFICFRVETPEGSHSWWGKSKYPFTETKWAEMGISVDSPEMIKASNKTILLTGRELVFNKTTRTLEKKLSIFAVDKNGNIRGRKVIDENAIDKGYGSFVRIGKNLYQMSYYIGENKTQIRLLIFSINERKL